jgi:hypothetical protein
VPTPRDAAAELAARIAEEPANVRAVAQLLDSLSHAARVEAIRSLGRSQQRRLYAAAEGFLPLRLTDLVPPGVADLTPVRHIGRNTLPAFNDFQKRFCRPAGADAAKPGELYGFNFQSLQWLTGPGYFVATEDPSRPEVWIDYRRIPPEAPPGWPALRSNERGVGRLVYGFMVDTLRRVSEHVSIGSAARNGKELGSWFVLCRQD